MSDYEFKLDDKDFKKKMKLIQIGFPALTGIMLGKLGMRLMAKVKVLTPVDTGLLRRSWFLSKPIITPKDASIEIKNNVQYAMSQEYGAKGKEGRFMLRKGFEETSSQASKILEAEVQAFINKIGGGK